MWVRVKTESLVKVPGGPMMLQVERNSFKITCSLQFNSYEQAGSDCCVFIVPRNVGYPFLKVNSSIGQLT